MAKAFLQLTSKSKIRLLSVLLIISSFGGTVANFHSLAKKGTIRQERELPKIRHLTRKIPDFVSQAAAPT
jgi:hypothetical protein